MLFTNFNEVMETVLHYMEFRENHRGLAPDGEINLLCNILRVNRADLFRTARAYRRINHNDYTIGRLAGELGRHQDM